MLQHITDTGDLHYHCDNKKCVYHASKGTLNTAHVSHEEVRYMAPGLVALPVCACGTQMVLKVAFSEDELQTPTVQRDASGRITSVEIPEGLPPNFVMIDVDDETQAINGVVQHPAIARHLKLAEHLERVGKHNPTTPFL